jgi:hypothetical protein
VKALCKYKKSELEQILPVVAAAGGEVRFICRKCARLAPKKGWLCKPLAIKKVAEPEAATVDTDSQ